MFINTKYMDYQCDQIVHLRNYLHKKAYFKQFKLFENEQFDYGNLIFKCKFSIKPFLKTATGGQIGLINNHKDLYNRFPNYIDFCRYMSRTFDNMQFIIPGALIGHSEHLHESLDFVFHEDFNKDFDYNDENIINMNHGLPQVFEFMRGSYRIYFKHISRFNYHDSIFEISFEFTPIEFRKMIDVETYKYNKELYTKLIVKTANEI